jgi:hypothetical protein
MILSPESIFTKEGRLATGRGAGTYINIMFFKKSLREPNLLGHFVWDLTTS